MIKGLFVASLLLFVALFLGGCSLTGGDQPKPVVDQANINSLEDVKVKPAEIELTERPGDKAAAAAPQKTLQDVDLTEVEAFVTDVQKTEASSDSEVSQFNGLRDQDKNLSL